MVLPELPSDWADLSELDLADRVSRDSMIGVQVLDSRESA